MTTRVLSIDAIVQDPEVRGGRPVIAGTGLRVSDLATYHVAEGLTPDELAVQFGLELAQVHAALSHYVQSPRRDRRGDPRQRPRGGALAPGVERTHSR